MNTSSSKSGFYQILSILYPQTNCIRTCVWQQREMNEIQGCDKLLIYLSILFHFFHNHKSNASAQSLVIVVHWYVKWLVSSSILMDKSTDQMYNWPVHPCKIMVLARLLFWAASGCWLLHLAVPSDCKNSLLKQSRLLSFVLALRPCFLHYAFTCPEVGALSTKSIQGSWNSNWVR